MTLTIRDFQTAIQTGGDILKGRAQDSLKATGTGFKGMLVRWFSGSSKTDNRGVMDNFVSAIRNQYGDECGIMAKTLLAGLREKGKPLTSRVASDVLRVVKMEKEKIQGHNNLLIDKLFADQTALKDIVSIAAKNAGLDEVSIDKMDMDNLSKAVLDEVKKATNNHGVAISNEALLEIVQETIQDRLEDKKEIIDKYFETYASQQHGTKSLSFSESQQLYVLVRDMVLKNDAITSPEQIKEAFELVNDFKGALVACNKEAMTPTEMFNVLHGLMKNYQQALNRLNPDPEQPSIAPERFISCALELTLKTSGLSKENLQQIFKTLTSENGSAFINSLQFLGGDDPSAVEFAHHMLTPVFLRKEMCVAIMKELGMRDEDMPENVFGIGEYTQMNQVDGDILKIANSLKREVGLQSDKCLQDVRTDNPQVKSQLYDLFNHPSCGEMKHEHGHLRYNTYKMLIRSAYPEFLGSRDLSKPVPLSDVWRGIFGEKMPEGVTQENFAEKCLSFAEDKLKTVLGEEDKAMLEHGMDMTGLLYGGLVSGVSFSKVLDIKSGNKEITFSDLRISLKPSTLEKYQEGTAYGLTVDTHRWGKPTMFEFVSSKGTKTIDPNLGVTQKRESIEKNDPLIQNILGNVGELCHSTEQIQRVCQFLTQASTVIFRVYATPLGYFHDEHGPHNFKVEQGRNGTVKVTVESDPSTNKALSGAKLVVTIDTKGDVVFDDFRIAQWQEISLD